MGYPEMVHPARTLVKILDITKLELSQLTGDYMSASLGNVVVVLLFLDELLRD